MDTATMTRARVEINATAALELFEGAITHAGTDKSLPVLNAVHLAMGGNELTLRATDRYRLIEGKIEASENVEGEALIPLSEAKRIIALIKSNKNEKCLGIEIFGAGVSVSLAGNLLTIDTIAGNFPPTDQIFDQFINTSPTDIEPVNGIMVNPKFLGDYAKLVEKNQGITFTFINKKKPILIGITSDAVKWRAALMPMRVTE